MDLLTQAQRKVEERARCKRDKFFLAECLGYDFQPDTHAELFACFLKYDPSKPWFYGQDDIANRLILWPRGHYKSTAVVVEVIQAILNFPDIRVLLMQGSIKVTQTLLHQILSHFIGQAEGSRLVELFPEFCANRKGMQAAKLSFTTPARTRRQLAQATVTVASPRSVKSGQHYEIGFFDDLVNDSNYRNLTQLEKVREDFTLAQSLIDPGGYRIVTGTRYAFGDLYEQIIRWQAKDGKWIVSIRNCWTDSTQHRPDNEKVPLFPQFKKRNGEFGGFTTEYLLQMQRDDPATFACQMLNTPVHLSQQSFSKELMYGACCTAQDASPLSAPIVILDLASGDSTRADDSVIQVGAIDTSGVGYLIQQRGGQWAPMETALNVLDVCLRYRPARVMLEKSAAGQIFHDYLRLVAKQKGVYLPLEFIKIDLRPDAKNMRIAALAGVIKKGRFKFYAGLQKFDKMVEQALQFPKGKHDDWIDTAALLYVELTKMLLELPIRPAAKHAILAMMADRENAAIKVLDENERRDVEVPDQTGL